MNPVFWFLVILVAVEIWLLLCCLYKPIGRFISKVFGDAFDNMKIEKEESEEKE